jgi:quinol monooxygenase YgiN
MTAVPVVAVVVAKEGSAEVVREALTVLARASREQQACISYDVHESLAAPGAFVTIEAWRSQADLDAHLRSEHFQQAVRATTGHLAEAPAIHPLQPVLVG